MVSLARTPAEQHEMGLPSMAVQSSAPQYPYGCCICLDDELIEKLGLSGDMPAPGDYIEFTATAMVTSAHKDASTGKCRVELQIIDMDVTEQEDPATEAMERSEARRGRFYGGTREEDEDAA